MIVEDDPTNALALSAVLRKHKPILSFAINGNDCIDKLSVDENTELILLDLMMPEMDGYQTLDYIRNNVRTMHIPVIIITARTSRGEKERAIKQGANAYITKPIELDCLMHAITEICNQ